MTKEADPFGRRPERSLRDRIVRSQLGKDVLMVVTAGIAGGALNAGIQDITRGETHPNTERVDKALPRDGKAIDSTLPEQVRMGGQRVTLRGERLKEARHPRPVPAPESGAPTRTNPGGPIKNPF